MGKYKAWVKNDPKWLNTIQKALANGDLPYEVDNHVNWLTHVPGRIDHEGKDEVIVCIAHSRRCNAVSNRDLTRMAIEGREQADFCWKFIRKYIPGFEKSHLIDTGPLLGVRESRRIVGEYVMTAKDIAYQRKFDDVIAISGHGFDIHNPDGVGNIKWTKLEIDGETRYVVCKASGLGSTCMPPGNAPLVDYKGVPANTAKFDPRGYYDIPYRCLVPLKVDNLLVAGRCLSAEFDAQAGCRLIMVCLDMGQAAGNAAALSLKKGITPRQLDVKELQRTMIRLGINIGQNLRTPDEPALPSI